MVKTAETLIDVFFVLVAVWAITKLMTKLIFPHAASYKDDPYNDR
jgi:hypothetical protein